MAKKLSVKLKFQTYESDDPEDKIIDIRTGMPSRTRLEAKVYHMGDGLPLAAGSLREMAAWLAEHGFHHRPGSNGIWDRA